AALRDAGVRRYLLQSSGFWYAPGPGLADEFVPFISRASPGVEAGASTYRELEAHASAMPGIEFVALRYGFFYGPGTWYTACYRSTWAASHQRRRGASCVRSRRGLLRDEA